MCERESECVYVCVSMSVRVLCECVRVRECVHACGSKSVCVCVKVGSRSVCVRGHCKRRKKQLN